MNTTVHAAARKDDQNLALVALGAFALFAWVNRGKNGTTDGSTDGPKVGGPPDTIAGQITSLTFAGSNMHPASMGQLNKIYGSTLAVNLTYVFNATKKGVSISQNWPVRFELRLGHSTLLGWKTSGQLGFTDQGIRTLETTLSSTSIARFQGFLLTTPADSNQIWDLHAKLYAAEPDDLGQPSTSFKQLGPEVKQDGAIRSVPETITVSGSITALDFAQDNILRLLAGNNQSREFVPGFRTGFNPGMGQGDSYGSGLRGRPFRQGFERSDLIRSLQ